MLDILVEGLDEVRRQVSALGRDINGALAEGVNRTMRAVEQNELVALEAQTDRPTPFSVNALKIYKATPSRSSALLFVQPMQARYLKYAIEGGQIPVTLTPTRSARLNQYGNIPGKRRGLVGIKGRTRSRFIAEINGVYGVWQRTGRRGARGLRLLVKVERSAPRDTRWKYYETAEDVARRRLMGDVINAIDRLLR